MRHPRVQRLAILAVLAVLAAVPVLAASGYIVVLKDGKTIAAKEKYKIEKGRAIIILPNGIQTFVPADQIDVRKSDDLNRAGYGTAVVLPGDPQELNTGAAQPRQEKTLKDLIASREAAPREVPASRRDKPEPSSSKLLKTRAGFNDLATLPRRTFAHAEVTSELQQFFRGQGIEDMQIYQGTQVARPLLEVTTNSEGSVFKVLTTAANALLHIRDVHPNRVVAFELLLTTPARERAGQFLLTPEMATDLVAKKVDVNSFFVRNVQF
ncbi:MAG TPA: hypothetical protein VIW92_03950 [Thermoanaerobaculia bacterium]